MLDFGGPLVETLAAEVYEIPAVIETLDAAEVVGWAEGLGCGSNGGTCAWF